MTDTEGKVSRTLISQDLLFLYQSIHLYILPYVFNCYSNAILINFFFTNFQHQPQLKSSKRKKQQSHQQFRRKLSVSELGLLKV